MRNGIAWPGIAVHWRRAALLIFAGLVIAVTTPLIVVSADETTRPTRSSADREPRLLVEPAVVSLRGDNRRQQVVVTRTDSAERWSDSTRQAVLATHDDRIARVEGTVVVGVSDGETELTVSIGGQAVRVPVKVSGCQEHRPVHFANDVVPLFSKFGCNSGGCHGKASGQNGFKLSVFGYDSQADYDSLVKEARGRRLSPAAPRHSLLLAKATAVIPHGGGLRVPRRSADYDLLAAWIVQGMPLGADDAPRLMGLRVSPTERVLSPNSDQQILATAVYSDGSLRDVTSAAAYTSNAAHVVETATGGLVHTGTNPGEAAITVNYMGQVAAVAIQVPRPNAPAVYPQLPVNNPIDELVWAKLRKVGVVPSELCDDATFLRRVYLDTIGTLPTSAEVRAFLADSEPDKRRRWIDTVLERSEYADLWALKFADILLVDRIKLGERGSFELHCWLREQFVANRPYDQWVRQLITASGNSGREGPVNFFRAVRTPEELTRNLSQAFLGIRLECAQCHHHPFEKWSQLDFYGLAGFFNGLERKPIRDGRELVFHAAYREMRIPFSDRPAPTRTLDGEPLTDLTAVDPRVRLAEWLTAPDNPWFAQLAANRLWKHYLGRGLVEPEDDLRTTNPPTNKPLLAWLSEQVVAQHFDLKAVSRLILNSRVYQLSNIPNDTNFDDEQNFSHYRVKRLPAEVLLDAISEVTGTPENFPGRPPGTRAISLWDNRLPSYFLEIFGRPERNSPCECGRSSEPTMAQALHLMNAPEVEQKLANNNGRVARLVASQAKSDALIEELCLTALGRPPREKELQVGRKLFDEATPRQAAEDYLWTLLNSYDFLFIQ